ncbi:hypothetical protein EDB83DRAFT_2603386 [Lactarius deliciosus]|nr:hypothetical protein EDB83DRAFT_2603386 [Lactarius deliciosus]
MGTGPWTHVDRRLLLKPSFLVSFSFCLHKSSTQFVVEKTLGQYSIPPLLAVGYEGLCGAIFVLFLMPLPLFIKLPSSSPAAAWFDLIRGWHQLIDTPSVLYSGIVIAYSIVLFNFFGLSVTKSPASAYWSMARSCSTTWHNRGASLRPSEGAISAADAGVGDEDASLLSAVDALDETARLPTDLGTDEFDVVLTETQGVGRGRNGN